MNKELEELYQSYWEIYYNKLQALYDEEKPKSRTNPLLIKLDNEADYINADLRIMFFGQETNEWPVGKDVLEISNAYEIFFKTNSLFVKYPSFYCNGMKKFKNMIQSKHPNKEIRFVWNNIIKTGKDGKGQPDEEVYKLEKDWFPVIKDEIRILKPDYIIFFTGPYYDNLIESTFNNINYIDIPRFSMRQLTKFSINDILCFRTYHPNYLYKIKRKSSLHIDDYYNAIIDSILPI